VSFSPLAGTIESAPATKVQSWYLDLTTTAGLEILDEERVYHHTGGPILADDALRVGLR